MPLETLTIDGVRRPLEQRTKAWVMRTSPTHVGGEDVPPRARASPPARRSSRRDAGVVDQDVEPSPTVSTAAAMLASSVTSSARARARAVRGGAPARRVARPDPHVVALGEQPPRGLVAQALVGSGDQCRGHGGQGGRARPASPWDSEDLLSATLIGAWTISPSACGPGATGSRPADVGPAHLGRRRAPGLRREEVARLAGLSVDYLVAARAGPRQRALAVGARAAGTGAAAERGRARPPVPRRRAGAAGRAAGSTATSRRASSACSSASTTCR